jgi:hypothetical protein
VLPMFSITHTPQRTPPREKRYHSPKENRHAEALPADVAAVLLQPGS